MKFSKSSFVFNPRDFRSLGFLDRIRKALIYRKDPNILPTISQNLLRMSGLTKTSAGYLGESIRLVANNPHWLKYPVVVKSTEDLIRRAAYGMRCIWSYENGHKIVYPISIENQWLVFLEKYFSHSQRAVNIRRELQALRFLEFDTIHNTEYSWGGVGYCEIKTQARLPERLDDWMRDYVEIYLGLIAEDIFWNSVWTYPHNSIAYHDETALLYKIFGQSALSSEEIYKVVHIAMNNAMYGCSDVKIIENASNKLLDNNKEVTKVLMDISSDIDKYFSKNRNSRHPEKVGNDFVCITGRD